MYQQQGLIVLQQLMTVLAPIMLLATLGECILRILQEQVLHLV
jgi:hypothetical protein